MLTVPSDQDLVLSALRLGWYVSAVRGWNHPTAPKVPLPSMPRRPDNNIPLRFERSPTEQRIEAQRILGALAKKLAVDSDSQAPSLGANIDVLAKTLSDLRKAQPQNETFVAEAWLNLSRALVEFDAHVQDVLAASSDTQASAYELGRGLADTYWEMRPDLPQEDENKFPTWTSWEHLLGEDRYRELSRLLGALSRYFDPYTSSIITGSLQIWVTVAHDPSWRVAPGAVQTLFAQLQCWYELMVLGQDPSTLTKPYSAARNWHAAKKLLSAFMGQLILGLVTLGVIVVFLVVLSSPKHGVWLTGALGALGAIGVTTTSVLTRLKNQAQSVLKRIWQDAYTDLLVLSITIVPKRSKSGALSSSEKATADRLQASNEQSVAPIDMTNRRDKAEILSIIQQREITPSSVPPV